MENDQSIDIKKENILTKLNVEFVDQTKLEKTFYHKANKELNLKRKSNDLLRLNKTIDKIKKLKSKLIDLNKPNKVEQMQEQIDNLEKDKFEITERLEKLENEVDYENDLGKINKETEIDQEARLPCTNGEVETELEIVNNSCCDDSNEEMYEQRINNIENDFVTIKELNIQKKLYNKLFEYQRTGILWLHDLHKQKAGGIIGDEMGLGKTIQMIGFLDSLHLTESIKKPTLILCPATIIMQWLKEFHKWAPKFRIIILHSSIQSSTALSYNELVKTNYLNKKHCSQTVFITSYDGLRLNYNSFMRRPFEYVVLDEGHKIRNNNAEITTICKQLSSVHKIILSGTPVQNNLTELWCVFDFVYPGLLGTMAVFQDQFCVPIGMGSHKLASNFQIQTAYNCAKTLGDLIKPYLLRRLKFEIAHQLPQKTEQVIFCDLTAYQLEKYIKFINSPTVSAILNNNLNCLYGIDLAKKICNHPDLYEWDRDMNSRFGDSCRSGKMLVLVEILKQWKNGNNKVLVFCQTRQMLQIIESQMKREDYRYLRMDGTTPVHLRSNLVSAFNESEDVFVFLLTTKVGGLGLNLTSANKIILYDPDWNPSNDIQARERAWRIGQTREVTIYRLITKNTIEELVLKRQYYKLFLVNKVLCNPDQTHMFHNTQLQDLFVSPLNFEAMNMDISKPEENVGSKEFENIKHIKHVQSYQHSPQFKETKNKDHIVDSILGDQLQKNIEQNQDKLKDKTSEIEAQKIAKNSLEKLQDSRNQKELKLSSKDILTKINNLNHKSNTKEEETLKKLKSYFKTKEKLNKKVTTQSIISDFNHVKQNNDVIVFKDCLKKIATFKKPKNGNSGGFWVLKQQ